MAPPKMTKDQAQKWLDDNFPKYKILEWNGFREKCKFLDTERNVEFDYVYYRFKDKIKQFPNRTFGASKKEILQKMKKTNLEKYGTIAPLQNKKIKEKLLKTNQKKYGANCPLQNDKIKKDIKNNLKLKHGVENVSQIKEVRDKVIKTKVQKGLIKKFENKSMTEWSQEFEIPYSTFIWLIRTNDFETVKRYKPNKTSLEIKVERFLQENKINFIWNKTIKDLQYKKRPDFLLPDYNLIIECDGLFWHSDLIIKDKFYHQNKKKIYEKKNYDSLFFRSDEINYKFSIVKSIILNKLNQNNKIFARNTTFVAMEKKRIR